jgi:hypothetical protein
MCCRADDASLRGVISSQVDPIRDQHFDGQTLEFSFFASDAFEARLLPVEFNASIRKRPHCIDAVILEMRCPG